MKGETIKDATLRYVNELNAIPTDMIAILMESEPEDWREITPVSLDDTVYVYGEGEYGTVIDHGRAADDTMMVELESGEVIEANIGDLYVDRERRLPMWGTMWSFENVDDKHWLENGGLEKMADIGFRIFESRKFGYYFGIDCAGDNFYEKYWVALYKALGLMWHDPAAELKVMNGGLDEAV